MINDIYQQFIGSTDLRNISLSIHIPENFQLEALIDGEKINRILVNLLSNAMKYANKAISIGIEKNDTDFSIWVEDDGPGISDNEKEKIFQTFYQIADEKSVQGSGIGLAYSLALAETHHGTLCVKGQSSGRGSIRSDSSYLQQKMNKNEEVGIIPDSQYTAANDNSNDSPDAPQYSVLLVEDNTDLLEMEYSGLEKYYHVLKAKNGIEALQVIEDNDIDIVVSDVMMPLMNGLELCAKIKNNIEYSHIPVILLTAKVLPEAKVEGFRMVQTPMYEKPFTILQLHMQIRNLLKLRTTFQQHMTSFLPDAKPEEKEEEEIGIQLTPQDQEFIKKMQEIIEQRLADEGFSIDTLASEMNMSRSNFYRKLKALSGMPPNDYLKNCRLNKAAQLLKEGYRVTEVFERTGFGSSSYFAKCFKAKFGVLPKGLYLQLK